jgi:antitoxin (DNA-binding transcriptional repressor) of toxin-antitoxin stability system
MSLYVDLHQNPLSLSLLQQYLKTTKELIITDIQKPIAKIVALEKKASVGWVGALLQHTTTNDFRKEIQQIH